MNNIRIAWLIPVFWFYWQPLLEKFNQHFPNTRVFTVRFPGFTSGLENAVAVEVIKQQKEFEFEKGGASGYKSKFTFLSLGIVSSLLRFKPHVVFANSFGMWTVLALALKPIGGWKVVIAYEGSSPAVDYRYSPIRLAIRRIMVKIADAYVSNSQAGRKYLIEVLKARESHVFAQPYEVPDANIWLETTNNDHFKSPEYRKPIFLYVGKIIPRKGLQKLIDACLLLRERGIEQYTILAIGDGHQKTELEEFCQKNQLQKQIKWLGRIDYSKLGSYFQLADVFVLPTFEDTWGMVISEAMLCGKPILCSTGAGASELVEEGKNGYCFPPNDVEKLAEAIANFVREPSCIDAMGHKSRQIMTEHTPEKAATFLKSIVDLVTDN